jgi:hypothetical protein
MPQDPDVRVTSHDRHDPMLVAALAAGDLAGTERDQAVVQTQSCAECAALHNDLVAIARATATLPPPIASAGRDFRLTPQQAADLRRFDWRRFVPSIPARSTGSRNLGIALATFGLVGLFIGSVGLPLGLGSAGSASTPAAPVPEAAQPAGSAGPDVQGGGPAYGTEFGAAASAPAASGAASAAPVALAPSPVGSSNDRNNSLGSIRSSGGTQAGPATNPTSAAPSTDQSGRLADTSEGRPSSGSSPLTLLFETIIVVGILLIVTGSRRRGSPTD